MKKIRVEKSKERWYNQGIEHLPRIVPPGSVVEGVMMRQYLCECQVCHMQRNYCFDAPYPAPSAIFIRLCSACGVETSHTRVLTRRARKEIKAGQEEEALRQSIIACCETYGFTVRFLYESAIITIPISSWQFGYHDKLKTLRHESTYKVNLKTGDSSKTHEQFRNRKMSNEEVIEYIANHDQWRQSLNMEK